MQCQRFLHLCLPESDRSLLLPLLDPESMLLLVDVLKSASLCTNLPQDSLRGLLSTGDGGKLLILVGEYRAGIVIPLSPVYQREKTTFELSNPN